MVWFYGGGLQNGSASIPLYWGERLAEHGVIVITANYRLGALGFLAHPALSQESKQRVSGNYGLLDQIAALQWVHRNIAAFGGDTGRVTIFGQSSGSISVSALIASPLAKGLFRRAIGESGGLFEPLAIAPQYLLGGAEAEGVDFVRRSGATTIDRLREMPVADLLEVSFNPHFTIDSVALKGSAYDAYSSGAENAVDVLIGSNADEGQLFIGGKSITVQNYYQILSDDFPPALVHRLAPPPGNTDSTAREAAAAFETDLRFRWDMWTWARLAARTGSPHVYFYQFFGASHGMEMPYVFGHSQDKRLADTIQSYWTNFAARGDPNGAGLPIWSDFRSSSDSVMTLGEQIHEERIPNAASLRRIDRFYQAARAGAS